MRMTPGSWTIWKIVSNHNGGPSTSYVTADMLEFGCDWPIHINDCKTGCKFAFDSNEVMESWMIGNYSGHAKYVEITEK